MRFQTIHRYRQHVGDGYGARQLGVLVVALIAVVACGGGNNKRGDSGPVRAAPGTPVILISIDTLRSDHLPVYGYGRVRTPAIDAFRNEAILYERAYTHIGLTLPSHTSILSGVLPIDTGVRDNVGYQVPEDLVTLATSFKGEGYATGGFVSAHVLRSGTGISKDFDVYDDNVGFETGKQLGALQRPGPETLERAAEWLGEVAEDPFFLFFHIYEPHSPYEVPPRFAATYGQTYEGEIAAADLVIGNLIEELRRLDVYDQALVILLSDHGEGLMDHGEQDHLVFIYREVLQVPLLIKLPFGARAGSTVSTPAQLTDIVPTVAEMVGLPALGERPIAGSSLLGEGFATGEPRMIFAESIYPRIHFGWSPLASMIEGVFHFIDAPTPELYDLEKDPGEKNNVIQQHRPEARRLRAAIEALDRTIATPGDVDPATRAQLQALGYISGGVKDVEGPLPDPKDRVHVLAQLGDASIFLRQGQLDEALALFEQVATEEPNMTFVWQQLARVHDLRQDPRAALEALKKSLELSDGAPEIAASVAEKYFELGRLEQAKAHAEMAIPVNDGAYNVLAKIAIRQDRLDDAESYLDEALSRRGERINALITKSELLNRQGRYDEALEICDQAEKDFGDRQDREVLNGLYLERGLAYGHLGRNQEAERALRQAIELGPRSLPGYAALAYLLALENRGPEAGSVLQAMVTENPTPFAYAEAVRTLRAMKDDRLAQQVLDVARDRWPNHEALAKL